MKFETVKEFLNWLWGGDNEAVINNDITADYICFEVLSNLIHVYSYNSNHSWEVGSNPIDTIYGFFIEEGGHLDLFCDDLDYWTVNFTIINETLNVGSIYKIKLDLKPEEEITQTTKFIEL
jgi:hypothetical protein